MAASSEVVRSPDTGCFAWERPVGLVRFTEFSLTLAPPYRQTDLKYENPLCRLAARTSLGARACGQGCGLCGAAPPASHTCPFGMLMVPAPPAPGAPAARWVGRRFPDVDAMHEGLDRLCAEGIDEETILAHLAPNPIASAEEMRQAAAAYGTVVSLSDLPSGGVGNAESLGARTSSSAHPNVELSSGVPPSGAIPVRSIASASVDTTKICNLLEYLEEVHRLIAGAARPEAVCERFLRAVAAVVPFDEMAIYLRGRDGGANGASPVVPADWVIATVVESGRVQGQPQAQPCRLEPGGLGAAALAQRQILMLHASAVEPFAGRLEGPATLAIPFPLAGGGEPVGVWLAMQGDTPRTCALGGEVVRYMRLLSEFLGARVQQLEELSAAGGIGEKTMSLPAEATYRPAGDPAVALADALCAATARGSRHNEPFALLCLSARGREGLPVEALTREFGAILRPYDTLIADSGSGVPPAGDVSSLNSSSWFAVLPHAHEHAARLVAMRLTAVFEDVLDAHGGAEEQGARLDVGGSVWGADAEAAEQMIVNATAAAGAAGAEAAAGVRFAAEPVGNLR